MARVNEELVVRFGSWICATAYENLPRTRSSPPITMIANQYLGLLPGPRKFLRDQVLTRANSIDTNDGQRPAIPVFALP